MQGLDNQIVSPHLEDFGLTQEDVKNYKVKSFWERIKYYLAKIAPTIIKILNSIIYYTLKFIKSFVKSVVRMILGKEV